ncbi:MAG: IS110 family transposase [Chloroflexi bacterium]|nr:MAG: IS110 family transposase [Chloroflexota bacterium]
MVYIGVDLHRKVSQVAALEADGELIWNRRIRSRPEEFSRIFGDLTVQPAGVAFEATYGWSWFADLLGDLGLPAHMAHPLATKAISSARVKNDAVDAKTLAHLLRTNLLPEAWIGPPECREARRLVRTRAALVRFRSRLKCQVLAVLADHGVQLPELRDMFGKDGRRFLEATAVPTQSQLCINADLRLIDELTKEIHQLDRELVAFFKADPRMPRLRAIHGIGFFTAAVIIAEVWDVDRFRRPDQLCSWAGLTPKERSSAGHIRRSHITKQGSRVLRWALVEAATVAPRDPGHRRYFMQVLHNERRRTKIARLALARRLLTLCYYALRDEGGCRAYPVGQRTRRLPVTGALGAVLASTDGRVI